MAKPPIIWAGTRSKLLTQDDLQLQNGAVIHYDGPQNFIDNGHFEVNTQGWTENSGAVLARTLVSSEIPEGKAAGKVTNPGSPGAYISFPFSLNTGSSAYSNNLVSLGFTFMSAPGFVTGDASAIIYDVTNATPTAIHVIPVSNSSGNRIVINMGITGASQDYELRFESTTTDIEYYLSNITVTETIIEVGQARSGLVRSAGQLLGTNTNDSAGPGNVGQFLTGQVVTATNIPASATAFVAAQITFTAGDWNVWGALHYTPNGFTSAVGSLEFITYIADVPQTSVQYDGINVSRDFNISPLQFNGLSMDVGPLRVSSNGTDLTLYVGTTPQVLTGTQVLAIYGYLSSYTGGTPQYMGHISARRER